MWTPFAAMVVGSAAGLTGLTFIVVAFRFDVIAVSQEYRNRAAQVLTLFSTVIMTAALIAVPQPEWALGAEYVVVATLVAALLLGLDRAARHGKAAESVQEVRTTARTRPEVTVAHSLFVAGIAAAGLSCLLGWPGGMGFYAVSALLGLVWGIYGAWLFLTRAGADRVES